MIPWLEGYAAGTGGSMPAVVHVIEDLAQAVATRARPGGAGLFYCFDAD